MATKSIEMAWQMAEFIAIHSQYIQLWKLRALARKDVGRWKKVPGKPNNDAQ